MKERISDGFHWIAFSSQHGGWYVLSTDENTGRGSEIRAREEREREMYAFEFDCKLNSSSNTSTYFMMKSLSHREKAGALG